MAYYRFTAPDYDDALLAEGEFDTPSEVEKAVGYLAEHHGCQVRSTRSSLPGRGRPRRRWLQDKLVKLKRVSVTD